MPLLESLYKKYHPQGVTLVGVSVDDDAQAANAALTHTPVSFPIVYDLESKVSALYQVASMPSTVIIDRAGRVRLLHKGYQPGDEKAYEESLRALLKD
jgi:peroxiredoxin